jgi:hypothetical protein
MRTAITRPEPTRLAAHELGVLAQTAVAPEDHRRHRRSQVIVKILTHFGLPARAPPRAPSRRVDLFQAI